MRLYLLPYAGGSAKSYRELQQLFSSMVDVVPLDIPERRRAYIEPPEPMTIRTMARRIAIHIGNDREPSVLFGHSMGALLAFEVIRELIVIHGYLPRLVIVSGHRAPHLKQARERLHDLPDTEFDHRLTLFSATPREVLAHQEMMSLLRPRIRRDFQACETYCYVEGKVLPVPMVCMGGDTDAGVSPDELYAWSLHSSDFLGCRLFPGGHFYFLEHRSAVVNEIERLICLLTY